jgi:hypothetical protein
VLGAIAVVFGDPLVAHCAHVGTARAESRSNEDYSRSQAADDQRNDKPAHGKLQARIIARRGAANAQKLCTAEQRRECRHTFPKLTLQNRHAAFRLTAREPWMCVI